MAGSFVYKEQNEKYDYIKDVFDTLITRDIIQKFNIKNTALLEKLNNFLLDNISSKISASQDKYYLADHSFKYAKLGTKNKE